MKESIITSILAVFSVGMLILAGSGIYMKDRTAPVIYQENDDVYTYTEGTSYDELLKGMKAEDEKDGDVTASLRVSDLYVIDEKNAVVVYVAKDQSNNVGKLKRKIKYQAAETKEGLNGESAKASEKEPNADAEPENADAPILVLNETAVTLNVGANFNISRYVKSATDVNGKNLSRNVHVDGEYDMNTPGEYELSVYVVNSAGKKSEVEVFTLTVVDE